MEAFPGGFRWGTATAAHQVEGGNWNSDWWAWEHDPDSPCAEPSGDACDHWWRYPEDLEILAGLGFDHYRFSVEWSRIEPEPGEFSRATLDHYRRMCQTARRLGLEPVVTLHHFTSPRWLAAAGGWGDPGTADRFGRYAGVVAGHLGDLVERFCTINEPNIVSTLGYLAGIFPPGRRDAALRRQANDVLIAAHHAGRLAVKAVDAGAQVGLTLAMSEWTMEGDAAAMLEAERGPYEDVFLAAAGEDDFIGVQTYSRERIGPAGRLGPEPGARLTLMGYEYRPQALEATIRRAADVAAVPVFVTESGIATRDDTERIEFVGEALRGVLACLADGIEVLGYTYWSLLDNFEWALGYGPTFGLVAVDRSTQSRTIRDSARWLGGVARANRLPDADA